MVPAVLQMVAKAYYTPSTVVSALVVAVVAEAHSRPKAHKVR